MARLLAPRRMLVALAAILAVGADAQASNAGFGRLEGVVTSPVDGRGLPNVLVIVRPAPIAGAMRSLPNPEAGGDAVPGRTDRTDRDGTFSFDELPPGLYSLDVIGGPVLDQATAAGGQWVWTQVASVLVVPGLTATERVTLLNPTAPRPAPKVEPAPGT